MNSADTDGSLVKIIWAITNENTKLYKLLEETFYETIKSLVDAIEKRDPYTGGHTHRVTNYSIIIGHTMGLTKQDISKLKFAALMHDIGKIAIRDKILLKKGKLTSEEYAEMKKHTIYGCEIIQNIKQLAYIIPGVRNHHERYDGKGYPDGLAGNEIDLTARIISVADAFDAMTSNRSYRKSLGIKKAIEELKVNAGTQFDLEIVKVMLHIHEKYGLDDIDKYIEDYI